MAEKQNTKFNWITPALPAYWPDLAVARSFKDPQTGAEGPAKFSCGLLLDDSNYRLTKKLIDQNLEKLGLDPEDFVNLPLNKSKKDKTIRFLKANANEDRKPPVFDARNNKVPDDIVAKIGSGSLVRLQLTFVAFSSLKRVACYLNSVQLIKLEEYIARSDASPFDLQDGFEVEAKDVSPFAKAEKNSWDVKGDDLSDF